MGRNAKAAQAVATCDVTLPWLVRRAARVAAAPAPGGRLFAHGGRPVAVVLGGWRKQAPRTKQGAQPGEAPLGRGYLQHPCVAGSAADRPPARQARRKRATATAVFAGGARSRGPRVAVLAPLRRLAGRAATQPPSQLQTEAVASCLPRSGRPRGHVSSSALGLLAAVSNLWLNKQARRAQTNVERERQGAVLAIKGSAHFSLWCCSSSHHSLRVPLPVSFLLNFSLKNDGEFIIKVCTTFPIEVVLV